MVSVPLPLPLPLFTVLGFHYPYNPNFATLLIDTTMFISILLSSCQDFTIRIATTARLSPGLLVERDCCSNFSYLRRRKSTLSLCCLLRVVTEGFAIGMTSGLLVNAVDDCLL